MDRIVSQPGSLHTLPWANDRVGRPPPLNGVPATERSLMPGANAGAGGPIPRRASQSGRLGPKGLGDALPEVLGGLFAAFHGDQLAQLGLEIEGLQARHALVEVVLDVGPAGVIELPVEEVVEPLDGVVAVAHHRSPTRPRAIPNSNNAFWSALLPRWSLLITVPIGMSSISAIS